MKPHLIRAIEVSLLVSALSACVTVEHPTDGDPYESMNRTIYKVNKKVDEGIVKPVAQLYDTVLPGGAKRCISNFFSNLGDIWSGVNSLLQGRGVDFFNTMGRVIQNSTMGVGGCFDVATKSGTPKIPNDFGTTLAVWGFKEGPYLMLPILGPSNFRDGAGLIGDTVGSSLVFASPSAIDNVKLRNSLTGLKYMDVRYRLLQVEDMTKGLALDEYAFLRDAYLQNRRALVRSKLEPNGLYQEELAAAKKAKNPKSESLPQYEDPDSNLPQYEDPDSNLPQYEDPESPSQSSSQSDKQSSSDPSVPQYEDPESDTGGSQPVAQPIYPSVPHYEDPGQ